MLYRLRKTKWFLHMEGQFHEGVKGSSGYSVAIGEGFHSQVNYDEINMLEKDSSSCKIYKADEVSYDQCISDTIHRLAKSNSSNMLVTYLV